MDSITLLLTRDAFTGDNYSSLSPGVRVAGTGASRVVAPGRWQVTNPYLRVCMCGASHHMYTQAPPSTTSSMP